MKNIIVLFSLLASVGVAAQDKSQLNSDYGENSHYSKTNKIANSYSDDLAEIEAQSEKLIPRNRVYTYSEAVKTRVDLEKQLAMQPTSLSLRWALMRFYLSASNFVGGCNEKALEQARHIYGISKYIGCLAYEFSYSRMQRYDKAEIWYKRSLYLANTNKDAEWKDIAYNKPAQSNVKVSGSFNNWTTSHLYENYDGNYSRKVLTPKGKSIEYKMVIDDRKTIAQTEINK